MVPDGMRQAGELFLRGAILRYADLCRPPDYADRGVKVLVGGG
jgi:hypothetical protein